MGTPQMVMVKQHTVDRMHMPMVPTNSDRTATMPHTVPCQHTKTSHNTRNGPLRAICCRGTNNDRASGRAMGPVAITLEVTPFRALAFSVQFVQIVSSFLHSHLAPSLSNRLRDVFFPLLQDKDTSSNWVNEYTLSCSEGIRSGGGHQYLHKCL